MRIVRVHRLLQVCVTDEFRGLLKDQLVRLLRSEELRIEDEYQVFTAAMDWVLHDVAKRKKHVVEVLEAVRFPLLSPQRLFKYIEGEKSMSLARKYDFCLQCGFGEDGRFSAFLSLSL